MCNFAQWKPDSHANVFLNQLLFISAAAFTFSVSKSHLMGKLQPGSKFDPHLANLSEQWTSSNFCLRCRWWCWSWSMTTMLIMMMMKMITSTVMLMIDLIFGCPWPLEWQGATLSMPSHCIYTIWWWTWWWRWWSGWESAHKLPLCQPKHWTDLPKWESQRWR